MSARSVTAKCVPLKLVQYVEPAVETDDARPIGVRYLDNREQGSLSSQAIQLGLEALAAEAAVAIEHARLYRESQAKAYFERELRTAYEFQPALLPTAPPARDYVSAAADMVSCLSIGGDVFEYLDLDGRFGVVVGDVAGTGASAARLGARVQGIFVDRPPGADPVTTIAAINAAMVKKGLDAVFVTLFYGILSPDGELTYCNAGHNPPLLVGKNGVRRLKTGGLLVGLFEDAEYKFEVVPTDWLEKTLWAEADKLLHQHRHRAGRRERDAGRQAREAAAGRQPDRPRTAASRGVAVGALAHEAARVNAVSDF